ncbi:CapA family protein [Candidatus Saccharibacteria bacterium]|nr:CapA family protein [Candidatus Saccharibacteria bacterium]
MKRVLIGVTGFMFCFAVAFFGIQFFTKTGIFKIPGVVYIDTELSDEETDLINMIFYSDEEKIVLDKDVHITRREVYELPELEKGEYLFSVKVPVAEFYSNETNVLTSSENINYISINDLDFSKKLLSLDGYYYLKEFNKGAKFEIIKFESEKYEEEIKPLVEESFKKEFPTKETVLTFAQTGVTAMGRGMNRKLYEVGDATFFSAYIKDYLSSFDLTHTSNEASFSDWANGSNICADRRFIDTLNAIGLDIVELTGNHNQDCGDDAASETIDIYNNNGIKVVGGGKTATEAATPLVLNEKGTGITMLAYNLSTGGATLDNTPGANQYYEENAVAEIAAAKARGDKVIIDIQYYECSAYDTEYENATCDYANSSAGDQIGFFRHLIDLGADVVVGTSAHQPQTYELYGNGAIYYGLGNLFFDQIWWPGTTRSLILAHYFYNGKLLQTEVVPTVYDSNMQTKLMDAETTTWYLDRLKSARP